MFLPFLLAIGTTVLFGVLAIVFASREEKLKRELKSREELQKRRLYEIATLRALQDRIGYSLDIERIIDALTGSMKNLFPYATASSLLIEPNKLVFKTAIEESISTTFVQGVKKSMVASLSTLIGQPLPEYIEEIRTGLLPDNNNKQILASFFHIPLVVNGRVVGLINVSSPQPGLYKEEDMTILYQMTNIASNALTKLRNVIQTEEEKLLAMIGSLSEGVLFIDNSMQLALINQAGKKLLGLTEREQVTIADVLPLLSHMLAVTDAISQATTTKQTLEKENIQLGDKLLRILVIPVLRSEDGTQQVIGTTIMLHDTTLEHSLASLKEDFTNGIVHELRSPLTAIKSGAELLLGDQTLTASQEKLLTIIDEQTKRMLRDIGSLLDAAKMDAGKLVLTKEPTSLPQLIEETITFFQPAAETKHILLHASYPADLPEATIDKTRIQQVLENLIGNSLKYTPPGGSISIKAERMYHEHLPSSPTNPGILLSVIDTGSGIPKNKQSYLFSKFAQVGSTPIPHAQQGTGLGLYISKGIITAHGGHMFLTSEEGHGTTISFTLPINPATPTFMQDQSIQTKILT